MAKCNSQKPGPRLKKCKLQDLTNRVPAAENLEQKALLLPQQLLPQGRLGRQSDDCLAVDQYFRERTRHVKVNAVGLDEAAECDFGRWVRFEFIENRFHLKVFAKFLRELFLLEMHHRERSFVFVAGRTFRIVLRIIGQTGNHVAKDVDLVLHKLLVTRLYFFFNIHKTSTLWSIGQIQRQIP